MGSLQVRLLLTYLAIIIVTLMLAALSLFLQMGEYREQISYGNLEDLGRLVNSQATTEIQRAIEEGDPAEGGEVLLAVRQFLTAGRVASDTSLAIVDRQGRVISGLTSRPPDQTLDGAVVRDLKEQPATEGSADPAAEPRRCRLDIPERPAILCVSMALDPAILEALHETDASAISVASPAASLGEIVGDLMPRLLFSGLIGVAAALVLGFAFSQSVAAPLRGIARAARSVARGNYRQRVPATGPREVRDLAANFNRMTEEVQRSQQTLRDFLANISH